MQRPPGTEGVEEGDEAGDKAPPPQPPPAYSNSDPTSSERDWYRLVRDSQSGLAANDLRSATRNEWAALFCRLLTAVLVMIARNRSVKTPPPALRLVPGAAPGSFTLRFLVTGSPCRLWAKSSERSRRGCTVFCACAAQWFSHRSDGAVYADAATPFALVIPLDWPATLSPRCHR